MTNMNWKSNLDTEQPSEGSGTQRGAARGPEPLPSADEVRTQSRVRNLGLSGAPIRVDDLGQTVRYVIVLDEDGNERVVEDRVPFLGL